MKMRIFILLSAIALLSACSISRPIQHPKLYDLGINDVSEKQKVLPPIALAEVDAPTWLDGTGIVYRLAYKNEQELNSYAYSQFVVTPAHLIEDKLRARLTQSTDLLVARVYMNDMTSLKVRLEDFSQTFTSPEKSYVRVVFRATLFKAKNIIGQKTFTQELPAPTPNAEGAVKAFSQAVTVNIENLVQWMKTQPIK